MWSIVSAPSNLGLRPPEPGCVPGCAKAPEALREAGLHARLVASGALEAGVVLPGRYVDDAAPDVRRVRNQDGLVDHAKRLADRLSEIFDRQQQALVLGGDCSLLVGAGVALRRRGRFGLVHIDGHTDFRHPGNSDVCQSLAGEDLAAAIGRHWPAVADIEGLAPYFTPTDVVHIGCRDDDDYADEVRSAIGALIPAHTVVEHGPDATAEQTLSVVDTPDTIGYWLHLDVDVLDPTYLSAVDSPDPGGLSPDQLSTLLGRLAPGAMGLQVTVFDPDLDPDGSQARLLTDIIAIALAPTR